MTLPRTPSFSLKGKRALVVGASSGIGSACAVALAEHGADVTLAARRKDRLLKLVDEMRFEEWNVSALEMDVAKVEKTGSIIAEEGPFDILVNSAGLAKHSRSLETLTNDFDTVLEINLKGAYFLTQAVAKGLVVAGKPGSLINISSQMGLVGGPERAVYCSSKHAVEGFTGVLLTHGR